MSILLKKSLPGGMFLVFGFAALLTGANAYDASGLEEDAPSFTQPISLRNDHPLYLTLFTTALPDRAQTMARHRWAWTAEYIDSNTIIEQHNVDESDRILVDGEMQRFELTARYGLSENLELKATFPYLVLGGGYMDSFIQSFEKTFGFITPGARESRGTGEFRYLFRVNRQNLIDKTGEGINGLGEIPIQLKWQWRDSQGWILPRVALRGALKIPCATHSLLGNKRIDGGLGLLAEQPLFKRMLLLGNVDVTSVRLPLALSTLDVDPVMVSGSIGFEHLVTQRASWKWQWMTSTNPYPKFHPDMTALNDVPMSVGLGWAYRIKNRCAIQVGVVENITTPWPDFAWSASFQGEF